jgi:hypothetical protein
MIYDYETQAKPVECERCSEAVANVFVLAAEMESARGGGALAPWRPLCDAHWPAEYQVWRRCGLGTLAQVRLNTFEHVARKNWVQRWTDVEGLAALLGAAR